jgi:glycosyltransferase involved in cell wall biosynthesis
MINEPRVSVAIAVYNEAENLSQLLERLGRVLGDLPGGPHEMLFVDDGSRDATLAILESYAARDSRVRVISLSRNFGHQSALTAALDHVSGDVVVVMDGDLQDSPEAIPRFLESYKAGHDVVYAVRTNRKEGLLLRTSYFLFYRLAAALSDLELPVGSGDFGLLSRRVVEQLRETRERHRYLRGLRSWVGFRQTGIEVDREARGAGESKYGARGLFKLAFDGIFAFSVLPIRLATWIGVFAVAGASLFGLYALYARFFLDQSPAGFTSLILVLIFFAGVQLLFLGVIGEYVGRTYEEVKQRPVYVVGKTVGIEASQSRREVA